MNARIIARLAGTVTMAAGLLGAPTFSASAADCPDVDVTFARAANEPPGVGAVGQQFVDTLRSKVGGRSVSVYPVNYPATDDYVASANAGAADANAHVASVVAGCPNTKLVLGGNSLGALVIDQTTIAQGPILGFQPDILTQDQADHVAALALFGNPAARYLGAPVSELSPWYGAKTIDLCAPGDPICTPGGALAPPTPDEAASPAHHSYASSGMPAQAAAFAAGHL